MSTFEAHAEMFSNRLRKTRKQRRKWAARVPTQAYRIYDHDIPEVPLLVDRYGDHLHVSDRRFSREVEEHGNAWLDAMVAALAEVHQTPASHMHVKRRERQSGVAQYERVADTQTEFVVEEQGLKFYVNLDDYLDSGLFLDHRPLRAQVREEAAGKRVLNLFAYTGSFTVYAAAGGAADITTVDLSNTYLAWGERNLQLNGLLDKRDERVRADTFEFLRAARDEGRQWDLVVVDPPTFSNSKRMDDTFDVQRDHVTLLELVESVLAPDGVIYFSTNRKKFRLDDVFIADEITDQTVPKDFTHQRPHRCWKLS